MQDRSCHNKGFSQEKTCRMQGPFTGDLLRFFDIHIVSFIVYNELTLMQTRHNHATSTTSVACPEARHRSFLCALGRAARNERTNAHGSCSASQSKRSVVGTQ